MKIVISQKIDKPIYEQIVSQIKSMIISGELTEGDLLPSMRVLAKELRISVITTKRAYEELEREGFIVTYTGRGSFIAKKNVASVKQEQRKICREYLSKAVDTAKSSDIPLEELITTIKNLYSEE